MLIEINSNSYNLLKPENPFAVRQEGVTVDFNHSRAFLFGGFNMGRFIRMDKEPLCSCGCGEKVIKSQNYKGWNKFVYNHHRKGKKSSEKTKQKMKGKNNPNFGKDKYAKEKAKPIPLCTCGCGEKVKWFGKKWNEFINGHGNRGKKWSESSRNKISKNLRGRYCGKNNPMYGKCGPLAPNWKGGIAADPYCDIWLDKEYKQSIKDRDNNECQNPDCRNNCNHLFLTIHHIDYDKKNCHPWNLITLCTSCNSRANFNKEYWEIFYSRNRFIYLSNNGLNS